MARAGTYASFDGGDPTDRDGLRKIRDLANGRGERIRLLKSVLDQWGEFADTQQKIYAPTGSTGYLQAHLGQSGIGYEPGAAGGGGGYVKTVGVKRGSSKHPFYVHFGTAHPEGESFNTWLGAGSTTIGRIYPKGGQTARIYGEMNSDVRRNIERRLSKDDADSWVEKQQSAKLTFQKKGEPRRFRQWVSGQAPKPFVYFAYQNTSIYIRPQIPVIAARLTD